MKSVGILNNWVHNFSFFIFESSCSFDLLTNENSSEIFLFEIQYIYKSVQKIIYLNEARTENLVIN